MLHVVVVGAGLAGLTATLQASQLARDLKVDMSITVAEKCGRPGGNSMRASSGINALTPSKNDTCDLYAKDTLASGGGLSNPELVSTLVGNSEDAIAFLEAQGVKLSKISQLGGASRPRCHSNPTGPNVGFAITSAVLAAVKKLPNVNIMVNTKVCGILTSSGKVVGVEVQDVSREGAAAPPITLPAGAVILATGGFGANRELLQEVAPEAAACATTNGPWATGDGLQLGKAAGAGLVQLEQVQVHPTGFVDPADPGSHSKILAAERLRGVGGILLDPSGHRFVDELQRRDVVTAAMNKLPGRTAWLVLSAAAAEAFGAGAVGFYCSKGLLTKVEGVAGLAAAIGVEEAVVKLELQQYDAACDSGQDAFGKTTFPCRLEAEGQMYVGRVTPVVHYTMGGVAINVRAEALTGEAGEVVPGLYAAGEVAGGLHGANRLGGNSLLECVVYGRIAAQSAISYLTSQDASPLSLLQQQQPEL